MIPEPPRYLFWSSNTSVQIIVKYKFIYHCENLLGSASKTWDYLLSSMIEEKTESIHEYLEVTIIIKKIREKRKIKYIKNFIKCKKKSV